ncbi:MAG: hypothetical protein JWP80_4809 [Pseudomonas sp.]|nr:hypothetical protein [Pseudomonas sp.]
MAVVHVLLLLLRALAVGRVRDRVITVALRRRWRLIGLALGVDRLDTLRWFGHDVVLSVLLIQVIRTSGDEEQRAAQPDFLRVGRQFVNTDPTRWRDDHVTRTLRAIPVTTGVKIVLPMPAHP